MPIELSSSALYNADKCLNAHKLKSLSDNCKVLLTECVPNFQTLTRRVNITAAPNTWVQAYTYGFNPLMIPQIKQQDGQWSEIQIYGWGNCTLGATASSMSVRATLTDKYDITDFDSTTGFFNADSTLYPYVDVTGITTSAGKFAFANTRAKSSKATQLRQPERLSVSMHRPWICYVHLAVKQIGGIAAGTMLLHSLQFRYELDPVAT